MIPASDNPPPPAPAAPASSLLLVRDGIDGLEVLMLKRSARLKFAQSMLVFPGGRVDPSDCSRALARHADNTTGLTNDDLGYRFAAIRELFEETGLLLARPQGRRRHMLDAKRRLVAQRYRKKVHNGQMDLLRLAQKSNLCLAPRELVPFSHWITPQLERKRFDTRFYLAMAPHGQIGEVDGSESVDMGWYNVRAALDAWEDGRLPLMFPTRLNLMKLARAQTAAQALAQSRASLIVPILPEVRLDGTRVTITIPKEAGFEVTEGVETF